MLVRRVGAVGGVPVTAAGLGEAADTAEAVGEVAAEVVGEAIRDAVGEAVADVAAGGDAGAAAGAAATTGLGAASSDVGEAAGGGIAVAAAAAAAAAAGGARDGEGLLGFALAGLVCAACSDDSGGAAGTGKSEKRLRPRAGWFRDSGAGCSSGR